MPRTGSLILPGLVAALGLTLAAGAWASKPLATLGFYVHMATGACTLGLARAFPPIVPYKGQGDELTPGPEPIAATADFRYRCGDCTATGPVCFTLQRAALKTAGGKGQLYVLVQVDTRAVLPCHPLNPLNGQK